MPTLKQWIFILFVPLIVAIVIAGLLVYSLVTEAEKDPVVKMRMGSIKGLKAADGNYDMYLGVPYARVDENNVFGVSCIYTKI